MRVCIFVVVVECLLLSAFASAQGQGGQPRPADVRVIIDISGSMKKTDPQNLRQPAVDLIVRLLPDHSKAGLWTFGQSVNMLLPHKVVDAQWRQEGAKKASSINSVAMLTNIGRALEVATADHASPATEYQRNIILLTDGVVDIGPEAVANLNERKRILKTLLPQLKAADFRIHTIALSSDADHELMRKLSVATDGIFEVANSADDLMSTFLRIFDQAVPAERVPLDANGFLVDSSIQEFTALIFRDANVPRTLLVAPDGKDYSGTNASDNVNWYHTDKYDLITVQQPVAGQWQVKSDMAPGSRVTVVSNLQLVVEPLQSNIKPDQTLSLRYSFVANNEPVSNSDFLSLLSASLLVNHENSPETRTQTLKAGASPQGVFSESVTGFQLPGAYDLKLLIDGKTFKREFSHRLNVNASAFRVERRVDDAGEHKTYVYKLIADLDLINVDQTQVKAIINNSQGVAMERDLNAIGKAHWEFSFAPVAPAEYDISMQVKATYLDDSVTGENIKVDQFFHPDEASVVALVSAVSSSSAGVQGEPQVAASEPSDQAATAQEDQSEPVAAEGSRTWFYLLLAGVNLLVFGLGYLIYRVIAGKDQRSELEEMERALAVSPDDIAKVGGKKEASPETPTVIDVADDKDVQIPMSGTLDTNAPSPDATPPSNEDLVAEDLLADGEPTSEEATRKKAADQPDSDQLSADELMADTLMADNLFSLDEMDEDQEGNPKEGEPKDSDKATQNGPEKDKP